VLYFTFEESADQIVRNMGSIGIDLRSHLDSGLLQIVAQRPFLYGLEMHLATMFKEIATFKPRVVVVDPSGEAHRLPEVDVVLDGEREQPEQPERIKRRNAVLGPSD